MSDDSVLDMEMDMDMDENDMDLDNQEVNPVIQEHEDGTEYLDFERWEEILQERQPGAQNGKQNLTVNMRSGNKVELCCPMNMAIDLQRRFYDIQNGATKDEEDGTDPIWGGVTGAFSQTIDLRNVESIQTRPAGNYRARDDNRDSGGRGRGRSNYRDDRRGPSPYDTRADRRPNNRGRNW